MASIRLWFKVFLILSILMFSLNHYGEGKEKRVETTKTIIVKSSYTMFILGEKWAETFVKKRKNTSIQVTVGGNAVGIAALINDTTHIALASRMMKTRERNEIASKGWKLLEYKVALDKLSVYVNAKNPVQMLTLDQLDQIYTARITNWEEVGGNIGKIKTYGRENSSGTFSISFKEIFLYLYNKKELGSKTHP